MKKILYCLIAVLVLSSFLATGCTKPETPPDTPPVVSTDEPDDTTITDNPIDDPVTDPNIQGTEDDPVDDPVVDVPVTDDPVVPPVDEPVTPPATTAVDKELQPYWNSINDIASAAQNYYTENFNKIRLVSKNGVLYDATNDRTIDTSVLVGTGHLAAKYKTFNCSILLLKTEDIKQFKGINLANDGKGLAVFAVCQNPKGNSYLLTTARSKGGKISTTDYISVLGDYGQNHGAAGRLMSGTEEYNRILNFLSMYEGKFGKYYVRSVTKDNKYAVVVLSSQADVNDVKQYILRKENNVWEVVMDKLENESRVIVAVNKKLPDFNPELLPQYTIYDYKKTMLTDYTGVLHVLVRDKYVKSIADVKYIAGAGDYCYIVLENEVKYICYSGEYDWEINQVAELSSAVNFMTKKETNAPTFIIWDR